MTEWKGIEEETFQFVRLGNDDGYTRGSGPAKERILRALLRRAVAHGVRLTEHTHGCIYRGSMDACPRCILAPGLPDAALADAIERGEVET